MSTTTKLCQLIQTIIEATPALSMLDSQAIYIGIPPVGVTKCVTVDGVFSIESKQKQKGITLHLFMPLTNQKAAGDIHDIADAMLDAFKGSAILASNWTHQPDSANNIDHVVFPATIYPDLL